MTMIGNRRTVLGAIIAGAAAIGVLGGLGMQPESGRPAKEKAKIGEPAPEFTLKDTEGKEHRLADYKGKVVVLEWFNPDCPIVQKHHESNKTMVDTYNAYKGRDVVWIAINTGETSGVQLNQDARKKWSLEYPILLDTDGEVGRAYGAKTTPHMYIIDKDGRLVYQGAIDNQRKAAGEENYVRMALDQVLAGETVTKAETDAYGCNVKYPRQKRGG